MDLTAQETSEQLPEGEAPPPTGMDNQQASDKVPPHGRGKDDEEAAVGRLKLFTAFIKTKDNLKLQGCFSCCAVRRDRT